jgi:ribosomal protein S18 acetylase RimI-like enzyme
VHALIESAYRGDSSRAGWTTEADIVKGPRTDAEELLSILRSPDAEILTAYDEAGTLVACCQMERRADAAYFGMFSVRPSGQAAGVGSAVLIEAERIAREDWQRPRMVMWVIEVRTELIAWYERRGYTRTGEAVDFPYDPDATAGPIMPGLRFIVLAKAL